MNAAQARELFSAAHDRELVASEQAAFDAALAETDAAKRAQRYQEGCRVMNAELPWATLWVTNRYGVASTRLQDFTWVPAPAGGPYQAHPERWALAAAR